jgi:hypothetical protein
MGGREMQQAGMSIFDVHVRRFLTPRLCVVFREAEFFILMGYNLVNFILIEIINWCPRVAHERGNFTSRIPPDTTATVGSFGKSSAFEAIELVKITSVL